MNSQLKSLTSRNLQNTGGMRYSAKKMLKTVKPNIITGARRCLSLRLRRRGREFSSNSLCSPCLVLLLRVVRYALARCVSNAMRDMHGAGCWVLTAQCCAVLRGAARCCAVLRGAARCCAVLRGAARCCAVRSCAVRGARCAVRGARCAVRGARCAVNFTPCCRPPPLNWHRVHSYSTPSALPGHVTSFAPLQAVSPSCAPSFLSDNGSTKAQIYYGM